jgi:hypothetical protein
MTESTREALWYAAMAGPKPVTGIPDAVLPLFIRTNISVLEDMASWLARMNRSRLRPGNKLPA